MTDAKVDPAALAERLERWVHCLETGHTLSIWSQEDEQMLRDCVAALRQRSQEETPTCPKHGDPLICLPCEADEDRVWEARGYVTQRFPKRQQAQEETPALLVGKTAAWADPQPCASFRALVGAPTVCLNCGWEHAPARPGDGAGFVTRKGESK